MAEQLDVFPEPRYSNNRKSKYDWERWADGSIWRLVKGEDFTCSSHALEQQARVAAVRLHKRVRVRREREALVVQFYSVSSDE